MLIKGFIIDVNNEENTAKILTNRPKECHHDSCEGCAGCTDEQLSVNLYNPLRFSKGDYVEAETDSFRGILTSLIVFLLPVLLILSLGVIAYSLFSDIGFFFSLPLSIGIYIVVLIVFNKKLKSKPSGSIIKKI